MQSDNLQGDLSVHQEIRFRCPSCEKLYKTSSDVFEDATPEFECVSCQKSFLLSKTHDSFGLYQTKSLENDFKSCPKCSHLMPLTSDECPSCGVFVEKYKKMAQAESPMIYELNQIWDRVIQNFSDDQFHQTFLNACQEKTALNFAFKKYDELRKTLNYDALCEKYIKQIELRLEKQFQAKQAPQHSQEPIPVSPNWTQWIFGVLTLFGLGLLVFNKIRPTFPNVSGLIVVLTLLSFGLWMIPARNSKPSSKIKL